MAERSNYMEKQKIKKIISILIIALVFISSFFMVSHTEKNNNSTAKTSTKVIQKSKTTKETSDVQEEKELIVNEKEQTTKTASETNVKEKNKTQNNESSTKETNNQTEETTIEEPKTSNEIDNIKFEKDYIKFPIVGNPPNQFNGNNITVVLPNTPLYISLNELTSANKLVINSQETDENNIIWTSSNEEVAIFEEKKLAVYSFGTTTITATTESGLSASYTLKIISKLEAKGYISRDLNQQKYPTQFAVIFKLSYGSKTYCPSGKTKYDVKMTLYKNGEKIQTEEYQTNSSYLEIYYNDEEGTYYGEYTITDLCSEYTITGKTQEKTIIHKKAEETESE